MAAGFLSEEDGLVLCLRTSDLLPVAEHFFDVLQAQQAQLAEGGVVDEHETGAVGAGCGQMILSEGQLAQTEWLGTIRSLSGAVGLEVAQPVADAVRIGAGRVSLAIDMAQCDAALGGCAQGEQV